MIIWRIYLWYNTESNVIWLEIRGEMMSLSMLKMWISFAGIFFLLLAWGLIWLGRSKLKGLLSGIVSLLAYLSLILGGLIIVYIVFSGPTGT